MSGPIGTPVIIEAAITPLRWGVPAQSAEQMVVEATACIDAGAGIIHHHHDMRLAEPDAVDQLMATNAGIQAARPSTLVYTDYLTGKRAAEENAHLHPMAETGLLTMFAIEPGLTTFGSFDDDGLPTRTYIDGLHFGEAHEMVQFSKDYDVPISLGVFEPGHLRWIMAYEHTVGFSPGTIVKLYFGGHWAVDRPDTPAINFGLPPTVEALELYLAMMHGSALPWVVSVFGDAVLDTPLARRTLELGGHLRVGIEDAAGRSTMGNVEMVHAAVALAADVGRTAVQGAEAAATLRNHPHTVDS
jgi:3-keto-5-aminohexanoate cleavage enzyme